MDTATRLREEAREHERVASLEREKARLDRDLARNAERRKSVEKRLDAEIRRIEALKRKV
jgi:hypothetical protein